MQQMQSANQAMNSLNDIFTQGMLGDQSNAMKFQQMQPQMLQQNMDFLGPLFSMFGGY